jgi:hypothetical protein
MRTFATALLCWLMCLASLLTVAFLIFVGRTEYANLVLPIELEIPLILLNGAVCWYAFVLAIWWSSSRIRKAGYRLDARFHVSEIWRRRVVEPLQRVAERVARPLMRTADAMKDSLLDLGASSYVEHPALPPEASTRPLPPLNREQFSASLRGKIDETMEGVADVIDQAPSGQAIAGSEERVCNLLAELLCDAVALGLQMRTDAADALNATESAPLPQNITAARYRKARFKSLASLQCPLVWAEKYRLMRASGIAVRLAERSQGPYRAED